MRIAIPLPAALTLTDPHVFVGETGLVDYAAPQSFTRQGDLLVAEIPRKGAPIEVGQVSGIIKLDDIGSGVRFVAQPGRVAAGGELIAGPAPPAPLWLLLGGALLGGLLLNLMPCVFPILSLKALSLVRAGESEAQARAEGLAYSAGVVLACLALGAVLLALRAAGEQVGWAFQLQQPRRAGGADGAGRGDDREPWRGFRTADAGADGPRRALFRLCHRPAGGLCRHALHRAVHGGGYGRGAAAAASSGAGSCSRRWGWGWRCPSSRSVSCPRCAACCPSRARGWRVSAALMALPMGLTALALIWLLSRVGGQGFALVALVLLAGMVIALVVVGRLQRAGKLAWPAFGLIAAPFLIFGRLRPACQLCPAGAGGGGKHA